MTVFIHTHIYDFRKYNSCFSILLAIYICLWALRNRASFVFVVAFVEGQMFLHRNWNETQPANLNCFSELLGFFALRNIFKSPEKSTYKDKQRPNCKRTATNVKMGSVNTCKGRTPLLIRGMVKLTSMLLALCLRRILFVLQMNSGTLVSSALRTVLLGWDNGQRVYIVLQNSCKMRWEVNPVKELQAQKRITSQLINMWFFLSCLSESSKSWLSLSFYHIFHTNDIKYVT